MMRALDACAHRHYNIRQTGRGGFRVGKGSSHHKRLIVVGDRVLIKVDTGEERTDAGLILPQTVADKAQVASGLIVAVGPGVPMPIAEESDDEPWRQAERQPKYIPVQAQAGDRALFMRKATVEIQYEGEAFLIAPQSAILVLIREEDPEL
jgi:co-chaperonin GroES (HSP10)